jgi:predicted outer membrane repeat protein
MGEGLKRITIVQGALALAAMLLADLLTFQVVAAGGTVGTGTPGSCTESALNTALAGGGVVTFNCGVGLAIIQFSSQLVITTDTSVDGGGRILLSGNGSTRLFYVSSGTGLSLMNLTLSNGSASQGGAIYNDGRLMVTNSTLSGNTAVGGTGGAIYANGVTTITNSALSDNAAPAGLAGGINNNGTLTLLQTAFASNFAGLGGGALINNSITHITGGSFDSNQTGGSGGAIVNSGPLTISGTSFSGNSTSSSSGGGIYNMGGLTITNGLFYSNSAAMNGGAIYNRGLIRVTGSVLTGNTSGSGQHGGAIYNDLSSTMALDTSTVSNNSATGGLGGGIYNAGTLTVTADTLSGNAAGGGLGGGIYNAVSGTLGVVNSTLSGNFGGLSGGGIIAAGPVTVSSSTMVNNLHGSLVNGGSNPFFVKNTIVADNCAGTITSLGHNLESANTCGFGAAGDLINTNPLLGPLANNGGPTLTHALLAGSPAINAGTNAGCPATDQRGIPRPQFGTCDIGAFEFVVRVYVPWVLR